MSIAQALAGLLLVLSAALLAWSGPRAAQAWRIYAGIGRRRQRDASDRAPATPSGVADRIALLEAVGYRPLGVTSLALPDGEHFAWIVAADDAESYAMLAGARTGVSLTALYSAWPDGTWLGTHHPVGAQVDRRGLHTQLARGTLAEAATVHRAGLERMRRVHGNPRPIRTMSDMLALDADYRTRFGGMRLRRTTIRIMVPAAFAACVLLVSLALLVVAR